MDMKETELNQAAVPGSRDLRYREQDGIAVAIFDMENSKVNTLNSRLIPQFEQILDLVEKNDDIKGLVIQSAKKGCFVAGADIAELREAKSIVDVENLSKRAHSLFNRLEKIQKPIVAAIDGSCLGGGLELALSCHYRVASSSSKTSLGLPEVMLGLLPGAGGTQRLPRQIGLDKALPMMLTGVPVKPEKAKKLGLIDYICHPNALETIAIEAAKRLSLKTLKKSPKRKSQSGLMKFVEKNKILRNLIFSQAKKSVLSKTKGLYPSPEAILKVVQKGYDSGFEKGSVKESEEFAKLSQSPVAHSLMHLYFRQTETKKNPYSVKAPEVKNLTVLGAGLMGAGVGLVSIQKGIDVTLKDVSYEGLGKGQKYIADELKRKVRRRSLSSFEAKKMMSHLKPQIDYDKLKKTDLVIEAVFEDINLKHRVIKEVEAHLSEDAVFASNTSALPIKDLMVASKRPENFCGMHYFSPVHKMPLLEIIKTEKTSERTLSMAYDLGLKQGKTVIVVGDGPGFYTTRILAPFMDEAAIVCLEGTPFGKIDSIMQKFGYPVGPITLIDEVGIDVAYHVSHDLGEAFGERVTSQDSNMLRELMDQEILGRKSKKGFYLYKKKSMIEKMLSKPGKEVNPETAIIVEKYKRERSSHEDAETLQKRLTYRMINEALYSFQEGIVSHPRDGDIGAVFGLGFPPIFGGPFRYIDTYGAHKFLDELKKFRDDYGLRFEPAQLIIDMAQSNKKFYKD